MTDEPIKFYFADAGPTEIDSMIAEFNREIERIKYNAGTPYRTYPKADKGTGFSGSQTVAVYTVNECLDEGLEDFGSDLVEPTMQEVANAHDLTFVIR